MLTYNISDRGKTPIYEFLYSCIRNDIRSGRLPSGAKLPSKRSFAADNGVALVTVENAYEQLLIEGYIEARERVGYFVADIVNDGEIAREIGFLHNHPKRRNVEAANADSGNVKIPDSVPICDFSVGQRVSDAFPYSVWSKLMRRVLSDRERDFGQTPQAAGMPELRQAIAGYLMNSKNLDVDPECIIVGPGTEYLHSIILQLIGRSRMVAVEDPGYKKVGLIYENNEMKVMHIPLDEEGIMADRLYDSNVRLVHVSPSHHFPTGIVMSASRRHRLLKWAAEQNAYIIEDDYDSEFRFKGKPLPTLMSIDPSHVIYMNTFTGTLAPSIRIAYMVLPDKLMGIYKKRLSFISGTVSTFEQLTLALFIGEGFYERHIGRMRNRYRKLKDLYGQALKESSFGRYAGIMEDPAGLHMTIEVSAAEGCVWADDGFLQELGQRGIFITPMSSYCYNKKEKYEHRFVLSYIDLEKETLINAFDTMCECFLNAAKNKTGLN